MRMTEKSVIHKYMLGFSNSDEAFCLVSALTIAICGFDLMIGFLLDYN